MEVLQYQIHMMKFHIVIFVYSDEIWNTLYTGKYIQIWITTTLEKEEGGRGGGEGVKTKSRGSLIINK